MQWNWVEEKVGEMAAKNDVHTLEGEKKIVLGRKIEGLGGKIPPCTPQYR